MIRRFTLAGDMDREAFAAAYAAQAAQRVLRIIGIFARLALHDGKPRYLAMIPRLWGYLGRDLAHPGLAALADAVARAVPEPTPEALRRIADKCAATPTP